MKISLITRSALQTVLSLGVLLSIAAAADVPVRRLTLDDGFHLLYNLDFADAHQVFLSWQQGHPDDPMGPACEAAGLLFSEFNRLGVLEAQFYEDDQAFQARKKLRPDPAVRDRFNASLTLAEARAKARLVKDPRDSDALFAMTLASGLRSRSEERRVGKECRCRC